MGLAASQARLLLLTGRKDDVESGLMFLANQKLSLARKSADLSKDYSNSLNATKLMWANGSNDDINLTYPLLMKYNTMNTEGQYMLADNYGRAIFNDTYADKLCGTGKNSANPGNLALSDVEFLQSMMGISASDAAYYQNEYKVDQSATAGAQVVINYNDDDVIDELSSNGSSYTTALGETRGYDSELGSSPSSVVMFSEGGNRGNDISDLIEEVAVDVEKALQTLNAENVSGTGLNDPQAYKDSISKAMEKAIDAAQNHYEESLSNDYNTKYDSNTYHPWFSNTYEAGASKQAIGSNQVFRSRDDSGTATYVDINQMIKTLLNYFDQACGVKNSGYVDEMNVGDTSINNAHNTYTSRVGETDSRTSTDIHGDFAEASYYLALYYYANANGATRVSSVDQGKGSYMQSLIQNGSAHLVQYQTDGTWDNISASEQDSLVTEEADNELISNAEARYDAEKNELDYKESQIDLQITNLDAERSALDTEVDSVKSILNKNIERSFKMFQNA